MPNSVMQPFNFIGVVIGIAAFFASAAAASPPFRQALTSTLGQGTLQRRQFSDSLSSGCLTTGNVSCQNTTTVTDSCCFEAPGVRLDPFEACVIKFCQLILYWRVCCCNHRCFFFIEKYMGSFLSWDLWGLVLGYESVHGSYRQLDNSWYISLNKNLKTFWQTSISRSLAWQVWLFSYVHAIFFKQKIFWYSCDLTYPSNCDPSRAYSDIRSVGQFEKFMVYVIIFLI